MVIGFAPLVASSDLYQILYGTWNLMLLCFFVFAKVKQDFYELLSDYHVDGQQRWSKVKEKMETDPRYKAVETSAVREELFKNYVERLAKVNTTFSTQIQWRI